jgi:hypothetical protein
MDVRMIDHGRGSQTSGSSPISIAVALEGIGEPLMVSGRDYFEGDEDHDAAALQATVLDHAVGTIVQICNRLTRNAKNLLDDNRRREWGEVYQYNQTYFHRPHDLIAAAWRFRHDVLQLELPIERRRHPYISNKPEHLWLRWLSNEVESWYGAPQLVSCVQRILVNRYEPDAFVAESEFCTSLTHHFSDVPWRESLLDSLQRRLDQDQRNAEGWKAQLKHDRRNSIIPECECTAYRRPPCNQIPCKTTIVRAAREGWGPLE